MGREDFPRKTDAAGADSDGDRHPLWVHVSTALLVLLALSPILSEAYYRIIYLPQPAYTVKTYEKLYDVCAPYQMYLPGVGVLPSRENKYTVYLTTRQRWSRPTGYSIYCGAAFERDYSPFTYAVSCVSRIDMEPFLEYVETWKGIPIYGKYHRVLDTDGTSNWEYYDGCYLQFVLKEYTYTADVQLYDSKEDRREALEKALMNIAHSIIDQSAMAE